MHSKTVVLNSSVSLDTNKQEKGAHTLQAFNIRLDETVRIVTIFDDTDYFGNYQKAFFWTTCLYLV
jgi:hypothetical protein